MVLLALGIFTQVTIEQLPIGLLPLMSADLGASDGQTGLAVTVPGLLGAAVALSLPGMARDIDRRYLLVISLAAVTVSTILSAIAPTLPLLLASRVITGFALGLYFPTMPRAALAHVPKRHGAAALALAFAGVGTALLLGLPIATWLGTVLGWRLSFLAVGGFALALALAQLIVLHPVRAETRESIASTFQALTIRSVKYGVTLSLVVVGAQFMSYSYITRILEQLGRVPLTQISLYLLIFGITGLIGNFASGRVIARSPQLAVMILISGMLAALLGALFAVHSPLSAIALTVVWGLFAGMISVSLQSFVTSDAGPRDEAGTALNSAAFNIAIAGGALAGGVLLDHFGIRAVITGTVLLLVLGGGLIASYALRHAPAEEPLEHEAALL